MGTSAATRIQKGKDYISLHTRWDGFPPEMKEQVKNIPENWDMSIKIIKEILKNDDFGTTGIVDWINNFENALSEYKLNPTIETATLFYCANSFVHHLPNPNKAEGNLLEYWGVNAPDLIINYDKGLKLTAPKKSSEFKTIEKEIDSKYKVLRIELDDYETYIDLKYFDISKEELIKEILLLPLFWRDFYTITKKIEDHIRENSEEEYAVENALSKYPLLRLSSKLKSFYKPTKKYASFFQRRESTDKVFNTKEKLEAKEDIKDMLHSLIPFDMYVNSLALHLMIRFAGKVYPLTMAETKSDYKPEFDIHLSDKRLSAILFDNDIMPLINDVKDEFIKRESKYSSYHEITGMEDYPIVKTEDSKYIGIKYEENIMDIMESQRDIELKA